MNEHDELQLPATREVILPEETSAELTPEQAAGKAAEQAAGRAATEAAGKKFDEKFRSSCVSSAVESGAPPPLAVRTCTCAIDEINKKYSVTEKMTLSDEQAMAIVIPCAKKAVQQ